jgi:ABC-2 type transport system permease protein
MIFTLIKKELDSYFSSPLAYVLIGLFSLITGIIFFNLLVTYSDGMQSLPSTMTEQISFIDEVVLRLFGNINFLFLFFIPLITMRLFAEEAKTQTLNIFFLAPVKTWQIVCAKFFVAFSLIFAMLLMTIIYPVIILGAGVRDFSILFSAYLSVFLNALSYISLGLFCSTLSSNQIVSGLLSILGIMFLWMISWGGHLNSNFLISEIFIYVGITSHFEKVLKGLIGTQDIIYYLTFVSFFLFLSIKSIGRRYW